MLLERIESLEGTRNGMRERSRCGSGRLSDPGFGLSLNHALCAAPLKPTRLTVCMIADASFKCMGLRDKAGSWAVTCDEVGSGAVLNATQRHSWTGRPARRDLLTAPQLHISMYVASLHSVSGLVEASRTTTGRSFSKSRENARDRTGDLRMVASDCNPPLLPLSHIL